MKQKNYTPIILAAMTIAILAIIVVFTWWLPSQPETAAQPAAVAAPPTPQPVANTEQILSVVTALAGTPTRIPAPITTETIAVQATLVQKWQPGKVGTPDPEMVSIFETWEAEGDMVPPPQYFETQEAIVQTEIVQTATAWPTPVPPAETSFGLDDPEFIALATLVPINDDFINNLKTQVPEELVTSGHIACGSLQRPGSPLSQYFDGANYWVLYGHNKIGDREIPEFSLDEVPYGGVPIPEGNYVIPADAVYWYCIIRD